MHAAGFNGDRMLQYVWAACSMAVIILGDVTLLPALAEAEQKEFSLYIGYTLPKEPDSAADAAHLESKALGQRAFCDQGCKDKDNNCRRQCEIAFRRGVRGIPGAEFKIAECPKNSCDKVAVLGDIPTGRETDPKLNIWLSYLQPSRYSKTDLFYTMEGGHCVFHPENGVGAPQELPWLCDLINSSFADALNLAIKNEDKTRMKSILSRMAPLNTSGMCGAAQAGAPTLNPLEEAIRNNDEGIIELLLPHLANVEMRGKALAYAASQGKKEVVLLLLAGGAAPNSECEDLFSFRVGVFGHIRASYFHTALNRAVYGNYKEIVELLLNHGARPSGFTLFLAAERGYKEIVKLLLESKVRININGLVDDTVGRRVCTPLCGAIYYGDEEVVQLFLEHGALVEVEYDYPGMVTALGLAAREGHMKIVKILLEHGADINKWSGDTFYGEGGGPLFIALGHGHLKVAEFLLDKGADVNKALCSTATHITHYKDLIEKAMQFLLAHGANVNAKYEDRYTPLHCAVFSGNLEAVKFLLGHGAVVNAKDNHGNAPLHEVAGAGYGIGAGNVEVAKLLIAHGAHVNAKNKNGKTPLALAMSRNYKDIVNVLREHGGEK